MAKAQFHKNQRVYVKPVATWALIERVLPQWAKGLNEPIRIHYDVGLGRNFAAEELEPEAAADFRPLGVTENWRVMRQKNRWQMPDECAHHPYPGTFPIVVTSDKDWGGWRVPGAEYDLNPERIELQARIMAASFAMTRLLEQLAGLAERSPEAFGGDLARLIEDARGILRHVHQTQEGAGEPHKVLDEPPPMDDGAPAASLGREGPPAIRNGEL